MNNILTYPHSPQSQVCWLQAYPLKFLMPECELYAWSWQYGCKHSISCDQNLLVKGILRAILLIISLKHVNIVIQRNSIYIYFANKCRYFTNTSLLAIPIIPITSRDLLLFDNQTYVQYQDWIGQSCDGLDSVWLKMSCFLSVYTKDLCEQLDYWVL